MIDTYSVVECTTYTYMYSRMDVSSSYTKWMNTESNLIEIYGEFNKILSLSWYLNLIKIYFPTDWTFLCFTRIILNHIYFYVYRAQASHITGKKYVTNRLALLTLLTIYYPIQSNKKIDWLIALQPKRRLQDNQFGNENNKRR